MNQNFPNVLLFLVTTSKKKNEQWISSTAHDLLITPNGKEPKLKIIMQICHENVQDIFFKYTELIKKHCPKNLELKPLHFGKWRLLFIIYSLLKARIKYFLYLSSLIVGERFPKSGEVFQFTVDSEFDVVFSLFSCYDCFWV